MNADELRTVKRENSKRWYRENKERAIASISMWKRQNTDKVRVYCHSYYDRNKKKIYAKCKEYKKAWKARREKKYRLRTIHNPVKTTLSRRKVFILQGKLMAKRFYATRNIMEITGLSRYQIYIMRKKKKLWFWKYRGRVYYPIRFKRGRIGLKNV